MIDRTMLVDMNHFSFRWFGTKLPVDKLAMQVVENIQSFEKSLIADRTLVIRDWRGSKFRKGLYPEYKGNRKPKTEEQEDKMKKHFANFGYVDKILKMTFPFIRQEYVEADDIIMYFCQKLKEKKVILSGDQDLMQIGVPQFSNTKGAFISFKEQGFLSAEQFILAKALAGDNSDNIKGLERIGMKTALKMFLKHNINTYEDLGNIPGNTKSKLERRVIEGEEVIDRNLKLVDLINYNAEIVDADDLDAQLEAAEGMDWLS